MAIFLDHLYQMRKTPPHTFAHLINLSQVIEPVSIPRASHPEGTRRLIPQRDRAPAEMVESLGSRVESRRRQLSTTCGRFQQRFLAGCGMLAEVGRVEFFP